MHNFYAFFTQAREFSLDENLGALGLILAQARPGMKIWVLSA